MVLTTPFYQITIICNKSFHVTISKPTSDFMSTPTGLTLQVPKQELPSWTHWGAVCRLVHRLYI